MHSVLWRWRALIIVDSTGHLGVAKCLIRGGLCVRMPVARALLHHLLLPSCPLTTSTWNAMSLKKSSCFWFLIATLFCIKFGPLLINSCSWTVILWRDALDVEPKAGVLEEVTSLACYMLGWDQKPVAPCWSASFKSVTSAIRIVSHHPLLRVPAMLPKTTGTLAARKQGC